MPTCLAIASAVPRWSPVNITTSSPSEWRDCTAARDSALTVSATAIIPSADPSAATKMGVFPWSAIFNAWASRPSTDVPLSFIKARLPSVTSHPFTWVSTPWPGSAWNWDTGSSVKPRFVASATTARAKGCSESCSAEAANASTRLSGRPSDTTSVTLVSPSVKVPVLSSTTVCILQLRSNASALRIRMPCSAALPMPTMIAVGVARPIAQGQAITSTATVLRIAIASAGSGPKKNQAAHTTDATAMTTGTK